MLNRIFDLRFVIGAFFFIIGVMIFVYSFLADDRDQGINHFCGLLFIAFGVFMILISRKTDASDDVPEADGERNNTRPD